MDKFYLMHKNDIVGTVTIKNKEDGTLGLHVVEINNQALLPPGTKNFDWEVIDDLLSDWNDSRCIPLGRPNYQKVLNSIGIEENIELLPYCYLASLTDCYWFKPDNNNVCWEDINFRDNGFSSNLYKHLFYNDNNEPINHLNSPDITTDGALPKMWENDKTDFILIKGMAGKYPVEVCNEVIMSAILDQLKIPHAQYWIVERDGNICSACKCFINSNNEEFIPIANMMRDYGYLEHSDFTQALVDMGFKDELQHMFLADCIVGNLDRHARNYGIIVDSDTQDIKGLAPLFDHGLCCMSQNHGYSTYRPTNQTFNKTLQGLDPTTLAMTKNIDLEKINTIINTLPMDDMIKHKIKEQLNSRINKIIEFNRRQEHDIDREK